jgi:hypothetical protein
MKANKPGVIALLLWLLFVASNAFAVFKSPYPPKASPPDQTIVIAAGDEGSDGYELGTANKRK